MEAMQIAEGVPYPSCVATVVIINRRGSVVGGRSAILESNRRHAGRSARWIRSRRHARWTTGAGYCLPSRSRPLQQDQASDAAYGLRERYLRTVEGEHRRSQDLAAGVIRPVN